MTSYPKVYALGHAAIRGIFDSEVEVEEKIDGSQFSFGAFPAENAEGLELRCFSKRCRVYPDAVPALFKGAVATAARLFEEGKLVPDVLYRGEAVQSPRHNVLAYDRAPQGNVILYDVMIGLECYQDHAIKSAVAKHLGLEVVPLIYRGKVESADQIQALMDRVSVLGGAKIEGLVCKNYRMFSVDKKPMFGKLVSEAFKEVHAGEWKKNNPGSKDIVVKLVEQYRTPARFQKAVQHLRDDGKLTGSPKDIGPLIGEVAKDVAAECEEEIKQKLWKWAWPNIARGITGGLAEWYKQELLNSQFEKDVA